MIYDHRTIKTLCCCDNLCLFTKLGFRNLSFHDAVANSTDKLNAFRNQFVTMSRKEMRHRIKQIIARCYKGQSNGVYIKLNLQLEPTDQIICSKAFYIACGIGKTTFKALCKEIKTQQTNDLGRFHHAFETKRSVKIVYEIEKKYNIVLDHRQRASSELPATSKSLATFIWIENIFKFIGDSMPNADEIHLDSSTERKTIWREYRYGFQFSIVILS